MTTCESPDCEGDFTPGWSPDGSRIAFSRFDNFEEALWVVGSHGGDARQLNEQFVTIVHVAWSPEGNVIAVVGFAGPGSEVGPYRIYLVDPGSGQIVRTLNAPPGLEFYGTISWSPDGQFLAFDAHGEGGVPEGQGIYMMRADGTDLRPLTACRTDPGFCADLNPAWSPDGRQIVFTRALPELGSDGAMGDLFVVDAAGGQARRLTEGPGLDCCPAWQPVPTG
jgi:TolB protein